MRARELERRSTREAIGLSVAVIAGLLFGGCASSDRGRLGGVVAVTGDDLRSQPGELIREVGTYRGSGFTGRRGLIGTTTSLGRAAVTVALILEPDRPNGTALVYGHPTVEPADLCAPSLNSLNPTLRRLVEAGVTVALVDYPGVGTSGREPYMVASALGRSLLDVADYVRRTYRAQSLWIGGFSEGGRAALGASSLWQEYRPDLPVAGFVAGAPWVDVYLTVAALASGDQSDGSLVEFMVELLGPGDPSVVRVISGLAESYSVDPATLLDPESLGWLDRVASTDCQRPELSPKVHMSSDQAIRFGELVDHESRFALEPDGKVWLISGADDVFFGQESAQRFVSTVCSRSTLELRLRSVPGGHGPAAGAFGQSLESLVAGDAAGAAGFVDPCGAPSTPSA